VACIAMRMRLTLTHELWLCPLNSCAPAAALESSYRGHVAEFVARGEPFIPFTIGFDLSDFSALLKRLEDSSRGVGIRDGYAAHSTFWLVRNGVEVVGGIEHTARAHAEAAP
jgi:predicted acetyltransferase